MSKFETMGSLKEVQLPQGTVRYRESGTGAPLLFIHGLLVNGDLWRKVVPALAKNYRCLVPDLPLGSHEIPLHKDADLTPPGLAHLIADFIETLGLKDVTLVGNDTGGALCQITLTQYPHHFARLVLTDCDAYEYFFPAPFAALQLLGVVPGSLFLTGQLLKLNFMQKFVAFTVAKQPIERQVLQSYFKPVGLQRGVRRDVAKVLRGVSNRYTLAAATKFGSFEKPVLLVWAEKDLFFPPKYARRLAEAFPNAKLVFVPDSKSFVPEDQPERLVKFMEAFLAQPAVV